MYRILKYLPLLLVFLFVAVFIVPAILMGYEVGKAKKAWPQNVRALLPAKIETVKVVTNDFDFTLGGGGVCRGVSFKLSERTLNDIREQGLAYFADAAIDRKVTYHEKTDYWRAWRGTPVASGEEVYADPKPGCTENFERFLGKNKYETGTGMSGYYTYVTHRGHSNIWIFPEWGILVYNSSEN